MNINDDGTRPYIVDISSLPPSTLLSIVDHICVNKCLTTMLLLVHTSWNNWSPLLVNGWGEGQRSSPIFSKVLVRYSHSILRCIGQSTFLISYIFGKLSIKNLNILNHDVKECDQNFLSSKKKSIWMHINSTSIV